jgi:hypothetical protein
MMVWMQCYVCYLQIGMIGGMVFAWSQSTNFGFNIKQWRLFADVINDVGLTLELLSPLFHRDYFIIFACAGTSVSVWT